MIKFNMQCHALCTSTAAKRLTFSSAEKVGRKKQQVWHLHFLLVDPFDYIASFYSCIQTQQNVSNEVQKKSPLLILHQER
jgi:hypothetical protein